MQVSFKLSPQFFRQVTSSGLSCFPSKVILWADLDTASRLHFVSWAKSTASGKDSLWVDLVKASYVKANSLWTAKVISSCSWAWRAILKAKPLVSRKIKNILVNGEATRFWLDNWHPNGVLELKYSPNIIAKLGIKQISSSQILGGVQLVGRLQHGSSYSCTDCLVFYYFLSLPHRSFPGFYTMDGPNCLSVLYC
ncbi:hypothetical protein NE237_009871 [Protea cynaroides]|uniref:Uncharacterized protein n=1 Tax=Protea cynaroides TaxID=273540 RepID=A0A9Q0KYM2_9MAGN|nr:hypothetical protein NE237_009871 [Protea cynaroides]